MIEASETWCPAIELNETDEYLTLKAEVPGIEIKHLNINAKPKSISISGIHDRHTSAAEHEVIPSQLHYGQLECSIPLPQTIEIGHVRAELIDGLLTITMPKANIASPTRI